MPKSKRFVWGYVQVLAATLFWSGNFIVAQGLNDIVPPVSLAFYRWLIATLAFAPFALPSFIKEWKIIREKWIYLSLTSFIGITVFNTLIYFAGHTTNAINMSLIAITAPIFMIILSRIFLGEKVSLRQGAGIFVTLFGVVLLISKGSLATLLSITFTRGDLLMVLAAVLFAIYSILIKRKPSSMGIRTFLFSTFLLGLILLTPFYLGSLYFYPSWHFTRLTFMVTLYVGIFASALAFYLWNKAIIALGAFKAAAVYYLLPVFSGALSAIILSQAVTLAQILSMFLIISGILTANYEGNKNKGEANGNQ